MNFKKTPFELATIGTRLELYSSSTYKIMIIQVLPTIEMFLELF